MITYLHQTSTYDDETTSDFYIEVSNQSHYLEDESDLAWEVYATCDTRTVAESLLAQAQLAFRHAILIEV